MISMLLLILLLLLPVLLVVAVVVGVMAARRRHAGDEPPAPGEGSGVRRFFQYLLLAGLLFTAASGISGLLGRLFELGSQLDRDQSTLALQLTFTLIALPLFGAVAWWTWRRLREDPAEARSLAWAFYVTGVSLVALVVAAVAWRDSLEWLLLDTRPRPTKVATAVVWTVVWAAHHWWPRMFTPPAALRAERLLSSLVGLVMVVAGAVITLVPALGELLGLTADSLVSPTITAMLEGVPLLVVGALIWVGCWVLDAVRGPRGNAWLALVLLVGVAGGLLMAVVGASLAGYDLLVQLVGAGDTPVGGDAAAGANELAATPARIALVVVGLLVWWYHREVLDTGRRAARTEVRRVYEYLLAAIGLLAAAAGLVMVLVTLVEAIAAGSDLVIGGSAVKALLAALVLLTVGLPVWWWHWRQTQAARVSDPAGELVSPTRRTYLLVLFGVAGVTAVITLITLVYLVLQDVLAGELGVETMRSIRFPIGILATTSLLSAYHWTIWRQDRLDTRELGLEDHGRSSRQSRRQVLLVGAEGGELAATLRERAEVDVRVLTRTDAEAGAWELDALAALLEAHPGTDLVVVMGPDGPQAIPVR